MTRGREFDEAAPGERQTDEAVQAMARRQFAVSLAVAFAFLAIAGLMLARPTHDLAAETAARRGIVQPEAPPVDLAEPAQRIAPRG
ncbi:MAG: hypothetical protein ABSG83_14375 [Roseiarcus sp.]|jgi:hypothetical protein